ncbi:MAG: hypothetical protein ACE5HV_15780 [Acidobacteriota bacterium]
MARSQSHGKVGAMSPRAHDPAETLPPDHPLWKLHHARVGDFRLRLAAARQLPCSGWKEFQLTLMAEEREARPPVLDGIHSVGGKGIAPWFDVEYRQRLDLEAGAGESALSSTHHWHFRSRVGELPL